MSRYLHTMLRVGDLQRSIDFYSRAFGMKEIKRRDTGTHPLRRSLASVAFPGKLNASPMLRGVHYA